MIFSFKDEYHILFYIFVSSARTLLEGGKTGRKGGRKKAGRRQEREGEGSVREKWERVGRLSISDPVISITKIKIHGSHGH